MSDFYDDFYSGRRYVGAMLSEYESVQKDERVYLRDIGFSRSAYTAVVNRRNIIRVLHNIYHHCYVDLDMFPVPQALITFVCEDPGFSLSGKTRKQVVRYVNELFAFPGEFPKRKPKRAVEAVAER